MRNAVGALRAKTDTTGIGKLSCNAHHLIHTQRLLTILTTAFADPNSMFRVLCTIETPTTDKDGNVWHRLRCWYTRVPSLRNVPVVESSTRCIEQDQSET